MSQETKDATVFSTDLMVALRSEIVESQKARIDLLKYKLIAIAALGSIGLGLGGGQSNNGAPLIHATYILNIIPLVCLYVDLLCHHNTMRILVIGQFLKAKGCGYENFISAVGNTLSNIGLYLYRKRKSGSRVKFEEIAGRHSGKYVPLGLMYDANASAPETSTEKKNKAFSSGVGYFFELEDWALQWSTIFVSFLMCIIALCKIYPVSIRDMKLFDPYFILGYAGILGIILSLSSYKYFDKHRKALFAAARMLDEEKSVKGLKDYIIHNQALSNLIQDSYRLQDVQNIYDLLNRKKTFHFPVLESGLFPAADLKESARYTGYGYVWVRDNIYVAYAHYLNGYTEIALKTAKTLARYFISHKWRFEGVISKISDPNDPMNRPHIRFMGEDLSEIDEKWAHAQNDALGYFLWLFCKIHNEMGVAVSSQERGLLALFALYFEAICYWKDEDSGHWEETRKVSASSIGVVVGGLTELRMLLQRMGAEELCCGQGSVNDDLLDALISKGRNRMTQILPAESIQSDLGKNRRFDAALLFLIFPMAVVSEEMEIQILYDVTHYLQGDYGVRRYLGDPFWSADYKAKVRPEMRTIDVSDDSTCRDRLHKEKQEAQWCIFDPIISIIFGLKYLKYGLERHLQRQTYYFNRALGQLTGQNNLSGPFKCPELYYLEKGQYGPNDTVPLLWTQANLWMAFRFMADSLARQKHLHRETL